MDVGFNTIIIGSSDLLMSISPEKAKQLRPHSASPAGATRRRKKKGRKGQVKRPSSPASLPDVSTVKTDSPFKPYGSTKRSDALVKPVAIKTNNVPKLNSDSADINVKESESSRHSGEVKGLTADNVGFVDHTASVSDSILSSSPTSSSPSASPKVAPVTVPPLKSVFPSSDITEGSTNVAKKKEEEETPANCCEGNCAMLIRKMEAELAAAKKTIAVYHQKTLESSLKTTEYANEITKLLDEKLELTKSNHE